MTALVLAFFVVLFHRAPTPLQAEIADAISVTVTEHGPLFTGPSGPEQTASLMTSVGWYESGLRNDITGDHGRACGAWQHLAEPAECDRIRHDVMYAAALAWADIRASILACGKGHELDVYGSGGCGRRVHITRSRMALAGRLLKESSK